MLLWASRGAAQYPPERCGNQLTDAEVRARIASIQDALDATRGPSRRWWIGWMTTLAAIGAGQFTYAFFRDGAGQAASAMNAGGSLLGAGLMLVRPMRTAHAAGELREAPAKTPAQRRAKLRLARRLLHEGAESQKAARGYLIHLQGVAWIAATGLFLNIRYDDAIDDWLPIAAGTVVVLETRLLTAPTGAIGAWDDYRMGSQPCMAPHLRPEPRGPRVEVAPAPGGVGMRVRF